MKKCFLIAYADNLKHHELNCYLGWNIHSSNKLVQLKKQEIPSNHLAFYMPFIKMQDDLKLLFRRLKVDGSGTLNLWLPYKTRTTYQDLPDLLFMASHSLFCVTWSQ